MLMAGGASCPPPTHTDMHLQLHGHDAQQVTHHLLPPPRTCSFMAMTHSRSRTTSSALGSMARMPTMLYTMGTENLLRIRMAEWCTIL